MLFGSRICTRAFAKPFLLFVVFSSVLAAACRAPGADEGSAAELSAAVEAGTQHERARHWIDAIEVYEKALKHWPENNDLKYGLRRSKIHFGVERRYDDASFDRRMLAMRPETALDLFDEVLEHVRLWYVDEVTPTSFVAHGTESLYLALANEKFLARNLQSVSPDRVAHLRHELRERFWNRQVSGYPVARDTVGEVCRVCRADTGLPATAVILEYVFGGCNCLDDYSNFLTPDRFADLHGNINGEFVGLGIEMKAERGRGMFLVNVLSDSPAEAGGLHAGDYITRIDGTDCVEMTTDEAAKLLRGPQGSRVTLTIESPGEQPRDAQFARRFVEVKSIPVARMIDQRRGIAYIRMTGFQATSPRELDAALGRLSREGMRALVWDLRGNPGGLLPAATSVLDRFIDSGVLVSTRGRAFDQNSSYSATGHSKLDIPLALLVDEDSASASEIVAGAIHDHHRGTIIGRPTYGKWSVQSIYNMPGGAGLRLTTAKFYSPRGENLAKVGVRPDVLIKKTEPTQLAWQPSGKNGRSRAAYKPAIGNRGPDIDDPELKAAIDVLARQVQLTGR
jgi:carboxyl-terminal processing protease